MLNVWNQYFDQCSYCARNQRFDAFEKFISTLPLPLRIIDIGGENAFWEVRQWQVWSSRPGIQILLINIKPEPQRHPNIIPRAGDARDLHEYPDGSFDLAFSNSCIQLLHDPESQAAMAAEVRRLAPNYWVQTPNYWFPLESHTRMPFIQFLPRPLMPYVFMLFHWRDPRFPNLPTVKAYLNRLCLLSQRGLARLFPEAVILPERMFGLVKSWIALHREEKPADAERQDEWPYIQARAGVRGFD